MKKIISYLIMWLVVLVFLSVIQHLIIMPEWYLNKLLFIKCALIGAVGGVLYCVRGVYLNKCAKNNWDDVWQVWYYLRPIASLISGFVSCIFLKAGLLVLESAAEAEATFFGYLAIAFIAGYNVDNFMKKLESIAQSVWGVGKSRTADVNVE